MAPLLPRERPKPRGGRPRVPDRAILAGTVYRLRTGCQCKALPECFGSGSTYHLRMQQWTRAGIFKKIFPELVRHYHKRRRIQWRWTSLDTALVKAPIRGAGTGPNPTDRAKLEVKRHVLPDGRGVPLSVLTTPANVNDKWMVAQALDGIVIRPRYGPRRP